MKFDKPEELKTQLLTGDNSVLKFIYETHGGYCVSNIQRKFKCPLEDAEDILVDAIINFRDKLLAGKINHITNIRNYIYTTCVNMKKQKDYYTNRARDKQYDVKLFLYDDSGEADEYKEELLNLSLSSFNELGSSCKQILRYFYIYKLSMAEISVRMKLSGANSANVKKTRCYKKWMEIIKKQGWKIS